MNRNKSLDFERKHEDDLQRLRGFRLLDDDFMSKVFEDKKCAEFLLRIILNRDDLEVKKSNSQYSIKNLQGRSVRLDILAVDKKNRAYNIEIQRNEKIDDIITIHSVSPFRDDIENEFIQHRFSYSKDKSIKVNIVATNVTNNKVPGIILDIILSKKIESEFDIYDFYSMREAKNDIFFKSITDKTLKKYT